MKVWLIDQRGISGWGASNLTASSIYAILSHSRWILDKIKPVDIKFDSKVDYRDDIERVNGKIKDGIGHYRVEFNNFDSGFSKINLKSSNDNSIWGHLYLEYMANSRYFKSLPINIEKSFKSRFRVGDVLEITLKIKLNRDERFLHS